MNFIEKEILTLQRMTRNTKVKSYRAKLLAKIDYLKKFTVPCQSSSLLCERLGPSR